MHTALTARDRTPQARKARGARSGETPRPNNYPFTPSPAFYFSGRLGESVVNNPAKITARIITPLSAVAGHFINGHDARRLSGDYAGDLHYNSKAIAHKLPGFNHPRGRAGAGARDARGDAAPGAMRNAGKVAGAHRPFGTFLTSANPPEKLCRGGIRENSAAGPAKVLIKDYGMENGAVEGPAR